MDQVAKFEKYHRGNPSIYSHFVEFAREIQGRGFTRYSVWAVCNRVRWHIDVNTYDRHSPFKISNNHLAYYARLIMKLKNRIYKDSLRPSS